MSPNRVRPIATLVLACSLFMQACVYLIPVGLVTGSIARRGQSEAPPITLDSLKAGEPIRLWMAPLESAGAIPARFDDARDAMIHFTRTSEMRADSAPLAGVARLDVTRGKRKNPTRAFWGPIVGGTAGFALAVAPACLPKGAGNLCGLVAIALGSIPGTIIGTWWGLRDVPRWVTVPLGLSRSP